MPCPTTTLFWRKYVRTAPNLCWKVCMPLIRKILCLKCQGCVNVSPEMSENKDFIGLPCLYWCLPCKLSPPDHVAYRETPLSPGCVYCGNMMPKDRIRWCGRCSNAEGKNYDEQRGAWFRV